MTDKFNPHLNYFCHLSLKGCPVALPTLGGLSLRGNQWPMYPVQLTQLGALSIASLAISANKNPMKLGYVVRSSA